MKLLIFVAILSLFTGCMTFTAGPNGEVDIKLKLPQKKND